MNGRKRHIVVDTLGRIGGGITPVSIQDWDGAEEVTLQAKRAATRMAQVFADSAYEAMVFWAEWFAASRAKPDFWTGS
ncbi:unnamed protein product [Tuwongella immobilis]|uniref:Transposase IS4-like domain-containing protein n=1 Tax=Tuwongella immobilis TaxID=692036 RepID=A0A6C2YUC2_9BACT|nr:unnamed protein product [Tuwongella immobilis]VTS08032.1 unnamed protein product [Tuwongella immobilis]